MDILVVMCVCVCMDYFNCFHVFEVLFIATFCCCQNGCHFLPCVAAEFTTGSVSACMSIGC